jgi:CBS domain-containing protein
VLARHGLSYDMLQSRTAGDVMTRKVYSVDEDAPLSEIAELLEHCRIDWNRRKGIPPRDEV